MALAVPEIARRNKGKVATKGLIAGHEEDPHAPSFRAASGAAGKGGKKLEYRYEAASVTGFVQQLACNYLPHGYWFFVTGRVPAGKDPSNVDSKLMTKYGIGLSKQQRARRKKAGHANLHYLRYGRFWILVATHGHHEFFQEEGASVKDARRVPIHFEGYSISVKRGQFLQKVSPEEPAAADGKYRVRVQIGRETYLDLKAHLLELACRRSAEQLGWELWNLPFEPYAPIRKQSLNLLRWINSARSEAGLVKIPLDVIRYRRQIVKPFEVSDIPTVQVAGT